VFSNIVVSDFNQSLSENFEAIIRLGCIGRVKLAVDFFDEGFIKSLFAVEEISVLDVEMEIAEGYCEEA